MDQTTANRQLTPDRSRAAQAAAPPADTRVERETLDSRALFEILVRENADMLLAFLNGALRSPQAADELFQESIVVAWNTMDRFDRQRSFAHWLRGIARKLILAHYRKSRRAMLLLDEQVLDRLNDRFAALDRRCGDGLDEKLDGLRECLAALPEHFKKAVTLRYLEDVRGARLARRLETTIENTKKLLQRGRRRLLECLAGKLELPELSP